MSGVIVVGAGPVGLVAACELAARGVAVRVIDRLTAATDQSRAIVVHARSLEMFERMGIAQDVIDSGVKTVAMQMFAPSGRRLAKVDLDHVDSAFPFSVTTPQTETERILTRRLGELGGSIERGVELTGLSQGEDVVQARLEHADGTTEQADPAYVIAADGSHSTVRDQIGVHLAGSFKGERFILGDVEADHDLDPSSFYTYFNADGPLMVFPMQGKRVRIMAQIEAPSGQPPATTIDQDTLQRLVDERTKGITIVRSRWITEFEIHHAQVPSYRVGRVFLAGDAAHIHSPAGGQGMNTGMQDAFNLAWKLALVLEAPSEDTNAERLLDSYQDERHPVAAKVIQFSNVLTTIGTVRGELATAIRDHATQMAVALAPVRHAISTQTEEVTLAYRNSPIVLDSQHRHGAAVHAGDHLPPMPDPQIQRSLAAAVAKAGGHLLVTVARGTAPPALPATGAGWRHLLATDAGDMLAGYDDAIADPGHVLATRLGWGRGGRLAVRPDGYIGYVDDLEATTFDRYLALFR